MAMRHALVRILCEPQTSRVGWAALRTARCFSASDGKVFGEEEKAAENIYIKKMEKERKEKLKAKAEKEKAEAEKTESEKKT